MEVTVAREGMLQQDIACLGFKGQKLRCQNPDHTDLCHGPTSNFEDAQDQNWPSEVKWLN